MKVLSLPKTTLSCSAINFLTCYVVSAMLQLALANDGVTPKDVAALDHQLTPMGGLRTGNIEGTIPPWTGGITSPPKPYVTGGNYINPFAEDSIQFVITRDNYQSVANRLTTGHKALLLKHDNYKMNIYPTRRSASYSENIYKAIKSNAISAKLLPRSSGVVNSKMTSPFPLAGSAEEMLWNHSLRYRGKRMQVRSASAAVTSLGKYVPTVTDRKYFVIYAQPALDAKKFENKFFYLKFRTVAPARDAGNISLVHESIDQIVSPRKAWQYFAGQRRLRRSPNIAYDSYTSESNSLRTVDQFDMFNGAPDQYQWKIVGKKELYVPYNAYRLNDFSVGITDILQEKHINQELARYELHRVWIVEGRLRTGIRHIYSRRLIYLDEDSWQVLVTEEYDQQERLWRVQEGHAMNYYDQPFVSTALEVVYDLQESRYFVDGMDNEYGGIKFDADMKARAFSTSAVRREAKR